MNALPSRTVFEQVAAELAIDPAMVEKDWYVTQLLALLSTVSYPKYQLVFSGGTSLSKAHGITQRFSEDIDFKVIVTDGNPTRKSLSDLKYALVSFLSQNERLSIPESTLFARDNNQFFSFHIVYDTLFPPSIGLRPHVQVEFGISVAALEPLYRSVSSFCAQLANDTPEVTQIPCVHPIEIAADKISALVWRIPRLLTMNRPEDRSLVRHIHDLAVMENTVVQSPHYKTLVLAALQKDSSRNKAISELSVMARVELLFATLQEREMQYRQEYDTFVEGFSYAPTGTVPTYEAALVALRRLTATVLDA